jgi:hypothetical protein
VRLRVVRRKDGRDFSFEVPQALDGFQDRGQQLQTFPTNVLGCATRIHDLLKQELHAGVIGHDCDSKISSRLA